MFISSFRGPLVDGPGPIDRPGYFKTYSANWFGHLWRPNDLLQFPNCMRNVMLRPIEANIVGEWTVGKMATAIATINRGDWLVGPRCDDGFTAPLSVELRDGVNGRLPPADN